MSVLAGTVSNGNKASGIVASAMLFLFNFFFAVGMLAIPWLLPSEYAPLAIRTPAAALASASNWMFTFLVVQITYVGFMLFKFLHEHVSNAVAGQFPSEASSGKLTYISRF